jgi:c-di-GMP-binding flagellar brake protein YcgR
MPLSSDPNFVLGHRVEVLAILDRMQAERTLTTVEFGNGHAIVSIVLEVRRDANVLIFDIARDVDTNRALFASQSLAFISELDSIQIGFETNAASLVSRSDGPAALTGIPMSVTRLQRREWFRAALPVHPPIRCTLIDRAGNATPAQAIDLSCGGAGIVIDDAVLAETTPGSDHELILSLPEVGRLDLEATLRTVRPAIAVQGVPGAKLRLGFRFEGVPPKTANQIQRYVQRLEVNQLRVLRRRTS